MHELENLSNEDIHQIINEKNMQIQEIMNCICTDLDRVLENEKLFEEIKDLHYEISILEKEGQKRGVKKDSLENLTNDEILELKSGIQRRSDVIDRISSKLNNLAGFFREMDYDYEILGPSGHMEYYKSVNYSDKYKVEKMQKVLKYSWGINHIEQGNLKKECQKRKLMF